jgi:hypothetical protein
MKTFLVLLSAAAVAFAPACKESHDHPHPHADAPKGAPAPSDAGGHGKPLPLGTATAGPFQLVATRDDVPFKAGGEAPIDVRITTTDAAQKVSAVRFWIGAADAKGSVKAKADVEDPKEPDRFHTHVEIPDPLPAGARLYVEIETSAGAKHVGSVGL